jgi:hypothetical protein
MKMTSRRGDPSPRPAVGLSASGPKYIFECQVCRRRFAHRANNPALRKHKGEGGIWDCPCRLGFLVDIR